MARYLIDTNLLVRGLEVDHPLKTVSQEALFRLSIQQEHLGIVPQTLYELWNVCTRPLERNGLGLTGQQTLKTVRELEQNFVLYLDVPELYQQWKELVERYQVRGVKVHDTRLVAACMVHGLTHPLNQSNPPASKIMQMNTSVSTKPPKILNLICRLQGINQLSSPGIGQFDGTVEGAMKAGLEAYPP